VEQRFDDPGKGVAVAKNGAFAEEFAFNIRTIFTSVESKIGQFLSSGSTSLLFAATASDLCRFVRVVFRGTVRD